MQSNRKKHLFLLCLLTASLFAQQWEELRYLEKDQHYCPGGSLTLPAFDLIPFINSLPLDIKNIRVYNSDSSTLYYNYLFQYDPATENLTGWYVSQSDTSMYHVYYFKNGKCAGNWDGLRGSCGQRMAYSEDNKPKEYISYAEFGGEIYHHWRDTITYFGNSNLPTFDSMRCVYMTGSRGTYTKIVANYRLKYSNDTMLDSIFSTTENIRIFNGVAEHKNYYKELFVYSYNSKNQLEKVDYSIVNTDLNKIYKQKLYQYAYEEFGISEEKSLLWVDSLDAYVTLKEAVHTYNPQGLVVSYSFKNFEYQSEQFLKYAYDAKKRIVSRDDKQSSGYFHFQKWSYIAETGTTLPHPVVENTGFVKLLAANKSIIIKMNIAAPAKGSIQIFSTSGKVVHTIADQKLFSKGSHTIVQPMKSIKVPSGIYLIVAKFGKNKASMKATVVR